MSSPLKASNLKWQGETQRALAAYGTTLRKFIEFLMSRGISHSCLVVFSIGIRRLCCTAGAQKQQSQAHRKWTCSTRVTCAHRATELWRGRGGWLKGSISESFSHPHSPVRHGSERTSRAAPDNDDRITLNCVGILRFFVPPFNGIWWILYREPVTGMWLSWDDRGVPPRPQTHVCNCFLFPFFAKLFLSPCALIAAVFKNMSV